MALSPLNSPCPPRPRHPNHSPASSSRNLPLLLLLLLLFLSSFLPFLSAQSPTTRASLDASPISWSYPHEAHHSLHAPLDKTAVYWNYGGSTVLTQSHIRLTPTTQDRRGWLWNEYPLEAANWEVEWVVEVTSKPHFGGDGMCMWVLAPMDDPSLIATRSDALEGPIFGMKTDFKGLGVCLDVYDNDSKRNNPTLFVLEQTRDSPVPQWHHDTDFEEDMVTDKPTSLSLHSDPAYTGHKCIAEVRNTGRYSRILAKLLHGVLHVYVDTSDSAQYKFCLAVNVRGKYKDHHLAFTAATGGVADNYDLREITTRYLKEEDKEFDDGQLGRLKTGSSGGWGTRGSSLFWLLVNGVSAGLIGVVALQLWTYHSLLTDRIDLVTICQRINPFILPHYAAHAALFLLLLFSASWWAAVANLPALGWKGWEFAKKAWLFSPATVGPVKGHAKGRVSVYWKLGGMLAFYAVMQLYYLYRLLAG